MPRRKGSPLGEALEKLAAQHGNILDMLDDMMEAIWSSEAGRAFERGAPNPESDPEEFQRFTAALIQKRIDAHIGKRQRASGGQGKGVRRDTYKGKPIPSPEKLLADVQRKHADKRYRLRSFNWVCNEVAKAHGYKSAGRVKEAAASIKWPDPLGKAK